MNNIFSSSTDSVSKNKRADIKKYLILNAIYDSIYLDTTLTIKKHYKFNYLRKDNFEFLKYSNIGQTYNNLTHEYDRKSFLPSFSFSAKQYAYLNSDQLNIGVMTTWIGSPLVAVGKYTIPTANEKLNFSIASMIGTSGYLNQLN